LRIFLFIIALCCAQTLVSQEDFLAKQYFNEGDFEKAVVFYEKLVLKNPRRTDYTDNLVACYQQLEEYSKAESLLLKNINSERTVPTMFIELGYNYTLQGQAEKATQYYKTALEVIDKNPNYGFGIGQRFQKYALLDYALEAYARAMALNEKIDYNFQMARIYGEQGNIEKMYESYLTLISQGRTSPSNVLRNISDFINSDPENPNNIKLKRILLQRAQKSPDIVWNQLLSWLFIQQKQYKSALVQEKAIYKRDQAISLQRLQSLGDLALEENDTAVAEEVFKYVAENAWDAQEVLNAQLKRIEITLLTADDKDLPEVKKRFENLLETYGNQRESLSLQLAYAKFLTFKTDSPAPAIGLLTQSLELPLNKYEKSYVKNTLGDILVYDQKFNQALIYFSQIQKDLKNDVLGQEARFKVAQTSFYKGDFDWALTQLKVLRASTSQLIANDAMQLSLLISDNSFEDSTQVALKKYARADFLAYQNKTVEAIDKLQEILTQHKGEKIEDEALLRQGQLLITLKEYEKAEFNFQKIVAFYANGILADEANFELAELYRKHLNEPDKAKAHYEKIIYNYQDSYYFPQARKNYRMLRGDALN